jgi:hypothetical protein
LRCWAIASRPWPRLASASFAKLVEKFGTRVSLDRFLTMQDLTKDYDYARLIDEEKVHFSQIEITDDLREGGIHNGSAWNFYWQRVTGTAPVG